MNESVAVPRRWLSPSGVSAPSTGVGFFSPGTCTVTSKAATTVDTTATRPKMPAKSTNGLGSRLTNRSTRPSNPSSGSGFRSSAFIAACLSSRSVSAV